MERRCQSSYNVLNLAVGSQSFGFAKTSFFGLSSTFAKAGFLLIAHDLATAHDLIDGYTEPLCEHGRLSKSDRFFSAHAMIVVARGETGIFGRC
jgi:hypothetical protein